MRYAVVGSVSLLGAVFVVSAIGKLRDGAGFTASLRLLRLLPARRVPAIAAAVTATEVVLAVGLVAADALLLARPAGRAVALVALAGAGGLLVVLTTGVALALGRGTGGRCACFGATDRPLSRRHLVRNGLLLLAVLTGLASLADGHPLRAAGALIAICAGVLGAVLLIRSDDLVDLFTLSPAAANNIAARR